MAGASRVLFLFALLMLPSLGARAEEVKGLVTIGMQRAYVAARPAIEAAFGGDAKRSEGFPGVLSVLAKIDMVNGRGLAESEERLLGSAHDSIRFEEPFAERLKIQIVVARRQSARPARPETR